MSHEDAAAVQDDGSAVRGKRLPFWKALDGLYLAIAVGAPLTLLAAAYHVVQIARGQADLIDIATAGYVVAAIVALIFLGLLRTQLQSSSSPPSCGACIAYLCADGLNVHEPPSTATYAVPCFDVKVERYAGVAQVDSKGHYQVPMPSLCAVCGSVDARNHRDIGSPHRTDLGVVGSVANEYVSAHRQGAIKEFASPLPGVPRHEINLCWMRIPVCARHTLDEDPWNVGVLYETDVLRFQNYGF